MDNNRSDKFRNIHSSDGMDNIQILLFGPTMERVEGEWSEFKLSLE